jgi:mono/diheme cytochrome c family protein
MKPLLKLFAVAAAGAVLLCPAAAQNAKPTLYTAEQATAGAALYAQACAGCHGAMLEGTAAPALKGPAFGEIAAAQALTAASLLDVVANTMPQSDPGSLTAEQYNAIVAYILQQNGYPAGTVPLAAGAAGLKDTKITP